MNKKEIIILAAGIGSRLRPLTDNVPKTMVEVNGISMIERLLKQIQKVEDVNTEIFIVAGYKKDLLYDHVKDIGIACNFVINKDYDTTNNMYSLHLALPQTTKGNDLMIINADCVYDDEIVEAMIKHESSAIAIDKKLYQEESMKIQLGEDGFIKGISKKYPEDKGVFVSIDIYTFNESDKKGIEKIVNSFIDHRDLNSWTEVAIDELLKSQESKVKPFDIQERKWMEIDNLKDLAKSEAIFT